MKAFQMAATRQAESEEGAESPEEYDLEFSIGEYEFKAKRPTPAQISLLFGTSTLGGTASLGATYRFLRGVLDRNSYNQLLTLIEAGVIDNGTLIGGDETNEKGLIDNLIEQVAERPTNPPTGSSSSSQPGGKKSTGRSPGKGSTLSE